MMSVFGLVVTGGVRLGDIESGSVAALSSRALRGRQRRRRLHRRRRRRGRRLPGARPLRRGGAPGHAPAPASAWRARPVYCPRCRPPERSRHDHRRLGRARLRPRRPAGRDRHRRHHRLARRRPRRGGGRAGARAGRRRRRRGRRPRERAGRGRRTSSSSSACPSRAITRRSATSRSRCAKASCCVDATVPLAASVGGRATRMLGVWQGSAAQQAQELVPDGVAVVGALHTCQPPRIARRPRRTPSTRTCWWSATAAPTSSAWRAVLDSHPRPALRRRRPPRDGAHHRVADGADDLDEHPLQDPHRDPHHGPARHALVSVVPAVRAGPAAPSSRGASTTCSATSSR